MKRFLIIVLATIFIITTSNITQAPEKIIEEAILEKPNIEVATYNDYQNLGEFKITYYCPCPKCCGKSDGITATGTIATEGRTVAVDPSIISYGSILVIDGKTYIAEDCGGAIKSNKIDIYVDDHQKALELGVDYFEVFLQK